MEVVQRISLRVGFCGKQGRCYDKDCGNKTICMIGHEVVTETEDPINEGHRLFTKEVHRQWE